MLYKEAVQPCNTLLTASSCRPRWLDARLRITSPTRTTCPDLSSCENCGKGANMAALVNAFLGTRMKLAIAAPTQPAASAPRQVGLGRLCGGVVTYRMIIAPSSRGCRWMRDLWQVAKHLGVGAPWPAGSAIPGIATESCSSAGLKGTDVMFLLLLLPQVTSMAKKKGIRCIVTLECTEARQEGGTPSRYVTQKVGSSRHFRVASLVGLNGWMARDACLSTV